RLVYGQTLLKQAEEKGVKILPNSTVRDIIIEGDQIVGVSYYDKDRNQEELRAKITIDASGYIGIIRKLIPNNLKNGIDYTWGTEDVVATYREIIELKTKNDHPYREEIIIIYHEMIRPPGYVWIFS
ncbi:MAG: FAD-binding protein, partial [Candidatus Heimdallarchaeota archaeon]|nr:FAD-binding protein [Candidatus Heimdallarchaeota archaeon]